VAIIMHDNGLLEEKPSVGLDTVWWAL